MREHRDLGEALAVLAGTLESLWFGVNGAELAVERDRLSGTIRSYLIPRTVDLGGPMTVVITGPTGSGKSTLLNSISGVDVSATGALRPTTRSPIVLAPPGTEAQYRSIGGVDCHVATGRTELSGKLVLVDAPDLDSTSTDHRVMAETLIDNADIVVFVTSALRYGDDVPWQVLRRASSRGAPVINVLNRIGVDSAGAIVDFRSRLAAGGLGDDLVIISEHHLADEADRVPSLAVRSLRNRLLLIAERRDQSAAEVFQRVLLSTMGRVADLAHVLDTIEGELNDLEAGLELSLADRPSKLDLSRPGPGGYPHISRGFSRRGVRRWMKDIRLMDEVQRRAAEARVVDCALSLVDGDIRHWLIEEEARLSSWGFDPAPALAEIQASAREGLEGWVDYVRRMGGGEGPDLNWLREVVLLDAATRTESSTSAQLAFGEDCDVLVARARRELLGRLELIYRQAAGLVVELIRVHEGAFDVAALRASLESVAPLIPVHA